MMKIVKKIHPEENSEVVTSEKEEDSGRTDDPVRMYLKEMGNVELLSRVGEIEIAKGLKLVRKRPLKLFKKFYFNDVN